MKSELIHLLIKLQKDHPTFRQLIVSPSGLCVAVHQHGIHRFEDLTALEAYAWPQPPDCSSGGDAALTKPDNLPPENLSTLAEGEPRTSGFLQVPVNPS